MLGPCFQIKIFLDALCSCTIILLRKRAGCFALMWCGYPCSVSLFHEAMGQSAVCDCEISRSYMFVEKRRLLYNDVYES